MNRSSTAQSFKLAIIQHAPVFLNLTASLEKAWDLIKRAADQGADVIVFPETRLPGYPVWLDYAPHAALWDRAPARDLYRPLAENSITMPGEHLDRLRAMASKTGTYLVVGAHERRGGTLYNTMVYLDRGGQGFQMHRKLIPTYTERLVWGRGDGSTLSVLPSEYGNLGGLICWEHWMPLARAAMHAKGEIVHAGCVLSRGDILAGFHSLDQPDSKALELLEGIPGADEDLILAGGSAIIAPDSGYVAGPVFDEPCILYAEIQPQRITEGHLVLDTEGHYSRPDLFHLEVDDRPQRNVSFREGSSHA